MQSDVVRGREELATMPAYRAARRRYEIGRARIAVQRAAIVAALVAIGAALLFGGRALVWVPVTFVATVFTEWWGMFLMKGARRGLLAGVASMLLPLSVLRPCCGIDGKALGEACCTMPSACWAAGALVGLGMAFFLPKVAEGRAHGRGVVEGAVGMILGVTSVAVMRCSMLFWGETLGLFGGMAAGIVATSLARAYVDGLGARA